MSKIIINTDGASRGNPGPASIGVTLKDGKNNLVACISKAIGHATNNQAEYQALLAGLEKAASLGAKELEIRSDSELLVKQIKGEYRMKNEGLKPLFSKSVSLLGRFERYQIKYIPRAQNSEADALANKALDGGS
ncbi:ribonuclease HI family protein [Dehalococcoides mccartyi]|nr:ribonuclease HI family protein [Dehalococcoides mccartyi]AOV98973.1 ribonuclease [Dehalococcoides mccartyi]QBX63484.1 ribonuclease HI family protein [Dehalococcoides mccartyi]